LRVELYGIARLRAGVATVEVEARTAEEALAALAARCPGLAPDVVDGGRLTAAFALSLNGEVFLDAAAVAVAEGDVLLVVDAHAGG